MLFFIFLFVICVGGCYWLFKSIGEILFGKSNQSTYVDKTTHIHNHYHDNRSINVDGKEFKNLKK